MTHPSCPSHVLEPAILPGGRVVYGCPSCGVCDERTPERRLLDIAMEEKARPYLHDMYVLKYAFGAVREQYDMGLRRAA